MISKHSRTTFPACISADITVSHTHHITYSRSSAHTLLAPGKVLYVSASYHTALPPPGKYISTPVAPSSNTVRTSIPEPIKASTQHYMTLHIIIYETSIFQHGNVTKILIINHIYLQVLDQGLFTVI